MIGLPEAARQPQVDLAHNKESRWTIFRQRLVTSQKHPALPRSVLF
jgi:hypothetical protein